MRVRYETADQHRQEAVSERPDVRNWVSYARRLNQLPGRSCTSARKPRARKMRKAANWWERFQHAMNYRFPDFYLNANIGGEFRIVCTNGTYEILLNLGSKLVCGANASKIDGRDNLLRRHQTSWR